MLSLHLVQEDTAGLLQGECRVFGAVDTAWGANPTQISTLQTFLDRIALTVHRRREAMHLIILVLCLGSIPFKEVTQEGMPACLPSS